MDQKLKTKTLIDITIKLKLQIKGMLDYCNFILMLQCKFLHPLISTVCYTKAEIGCKRPINFFYLHAPNI